LPAKEETRKLIITDKKNPDTFTDNTVDKKGIYIVFTVIPSRPHFTKKKKILN